MEATRDKDNKLTGLHYSSQEDSERRTKEIEQMDSSVTASENLTQSILSSQQWILER